MNWNDYKVFDPGFYGAPNDLPRAEAHKAYVRLMEARPARIAALAHLLEVNGLILEDTDPGLQRLNDWFRASVAGDPSTGDLEKIWYGVVNDIGLFLGETMIRRWANLHWSFFTHGKRDVCYQRHVIMGFSRAKNPYYYADTDVSLAGYGEQIVLGYPVDVDHFVGAFAYVGSLA